jgi:hypothetical protein
MNGLPGKGSCPQEQLGVRPKGASRIRNNQPTPGPRKQPHSKGILQRLDAGAHRWLANAQGFRGAMKATKCSHCEKSLNLIDFHGLPASRFLHLTTLNYHRHRS